jgi:hypothetical protein
MLYGASTYGSVEYAALVARVSVPIPPVPPPVILKQGAGVDGSYKWKTKLRRVVIDPNGFRTTPEAELERVRPLIEAQPRGTLHKALGLDPTEALSAQTLHQASLQQNDIGRRARHVHYLKRLVNPLYQ